MKLLTKYYDKVEGKVLSYDEYRLFSDLSSPINPALGIDPANMNEKDKKDIIDLAEKWLDKPYPQLLASDFIRYEREGNRSVFEGKFFNRRHMAYIFALAEAIEQNGRFLDRVMDGVMLILDEYDWVVPAHIDHRFPLNPAYKVHNNIDLFDAETASTLTYIWLFCHNALDRITPLICDRLKYEMEERIIKPFLKYDLGWMGFSGRVVNNWNPWILSNVLTACSILTEDLSVREQVINKVIKSVDYFIDVYHTDGGCDEGPSYWGVAGAALFSVLEQLYDMTGGYIDIFDVELIRRMGEYEADFHIDGQYYVNFADCPVTISPAYRVITRYGRRVNSERLMNFGAYYAEKYGSNLSSARWSLYSSVKCMFEAPLKGVEYKPSLQSWYDGICVMSERETDSTTNGFFFAIKGGHNDESHNHNDIGNFIVYKDGKPLIIDTGCGQYTKRTFSSERYKIWTMVSDYHNLPSVNGLSQLPGEKYRANKVSYSAENHSLSLNIEGAYPENSGIKSIRRTGAMVDGAITVTDEIALDEPGSAEFVLISAKKPTVTASGEIDFDGEAKLTCSENLTPCIDESFDMEMEDGSIRERWGMELYRIILKSKEFTSDKFAVTITH